MICKLKKECALISPSLAFGVGLLQEKDQQPGRSAERKENCRPYPFIRHPVLSCPIGGLGCRKRLVAFQPPDKICELYGPHALAINLNPARPLDGYLISQWVQDFAPRRAVMVVSIFMTTDVNPRIAPSNYCVR